jgi:hypothetical protein
MKKTMYLMAMLFMAGAMVFTSCTKDEDPVEPIDLTPGIVFMGGADYVSDDATMIVGTAFKVGINASENATSKKNIASFKAVRIFDNISTTVYEEDGIGDPTYTWESTENANANVGQERWTFTVTDNDGLISELSFIITTGAGGSAVLAYADLNMGSFDDSHYGSFMATVTANVLKKAEATAVQPLVDIVFYNGATNGVTFAAPSNSDAKDVYDLDAAGWTTFNNTMFMASGLSSDDFTAIGDTYAFPSFTGDADDMNNLSIGDVIYFKTVTDKQGYIRINSSTRDGFEINIDMKIME